MEHCFIDKVQVRTGDLWKGHRILFGIVLRPVSSALFACSFSLIWCYVRHVNLEKCKKSRTIFGHGNEQPYFVQNIPVPSLEQNIPPTYSAGKNLLLFLNLKIGYVNSVGVVYEWWLRLSKER